MLLDEHLILRGTDFLIIRFLDIYIHGLFIVGAINGDLSSSLSSLFSQNSTSDETVFRETMQSTSFHTFASAKFYRTTLYDTFISLGRNGKARNGKYTTSTQNKVKFLILTADSC